MNKNMKTKSFFFKKLNYWGLRDDWFLVPGVCQVHCWTDVTLLLMTALNTKNKCTKYTF